MAESGMVSIYIMGKQYQVPAQVTIMRALEYAGYRLIRGCGCRGGFCGACGTVYRLAGDYRLRVGLACQTLVEPGMYLTQIPFFPANKAQYDIDKLTPDLAGLLSCYPELSRCLGCNTCTKVCPQDLEVMEYMAAAMRGDIAKLADLSFDCLMCGLCAVRCPAETVQYHVALLGRRLYSRYLVPPAAHLEEQLRRIEAGEFEGDLDRMVSLDEAALRKLYDERDIEP